MHLCHIASVLLSVLMATPSYGKTLIDFSTLRSVSDWTESSDTVRTVGASKAALTLQRTQVYQLAVFFALLNPQPNGAGFAGVYTTPDWDLRPFDELRVTCRAHGQSGRYKIVLRHRNATVQEIGYEQTFEAAIGGDLADYALPLKGFKPYYRGREVDDAEPLDLARVTMFGIQVFGGVYSPVKQSGVSALEIQKVQASKSNDD